MQDTAIQSRLRRLKALSSPVRLEVLELLKDPIGNFPPQVDGDPTTDGICGDFLRERLGLAAATTSRHLTLLVEAGLLLATRRKGWTFYRRDDAALADFAAELGRTL